MLDKQLPLGVQIKEGLSFSNYLAGPNQEALQHVLEFSQGQGESMLFLCGESAGKSHLLQAACHEVMTSGGGAFYLPLSQYRTLSPQVLEGVAGFELVALDDIDAIAGDSEWEQELFHLYNSVRDKGGRLLVSSSHSPDSLPIVLPDLLSRLKWGLTLRLSGLEESDKSQLLISRAAERGFELSEEVVKYLLNRYPRDLHSLIDFLQKLDDATLVAQRKVTIPFVRELLLQAD